MGGGEEIWRGDGQANAEEGLNLQAEVVAVICEARDLGFVREDSRRDGLRCVVVRKGAEVEGSDKG